MKRYTGRAIEVTHDPCAGCTPPSACAASRLSSIRPGDRGFKRMERTWRFWPPSSSVCASSRRICNGFRQPNRLDRLGEGHAYRRRPLLSLQCLTQTNERDAAE